MPTGAGRKSRKGYKKRLVRAHLGQTSFLDDLENMFVDYRSRRRLCVHSVPAPWSRVILYALIYAMLISAAKFCWFRVVGKPQWLLSNSLAAEQSEGQAKEAEAVSSASSQFRGIVSGEESLP